MANFPDLPFGAKLQLASSEAEFLAHTDNVLRLVSGCRQRLYSGTRRWRPLWIARARTFRRGLRRPRLSAVRRRQDLRVGRRLPDAALPGQPLSAGNVHGHVRNALDKVELIARGVDPRDVLPFALKTWNFFQCILDPSDAFAVTIDRHAHDVAVGETLGDADRGLRSPVRYEILADAYRAAAAKLKITPSRLQATVWIAHRESISGTGHRGQLVGGA